MPKIQVVEPFTLNTAKGQQRYDIGEHEVSKEVAEHWYTQVHVQKPKEPKAPKPQTSTSTPPGSSGGGAGGGQSGQQGSTPTP